MQWSEMSEREKDAAVAKHVMEWSDRDIDRFRTRYGSYLVPSAPDEQDGIPQYTTDHNAFAEVLAVLEQQDLMNKYIVHLLGMSGDYYLEPLNWSQARKLITAPLDIRCLAALRACGVNIE